MNPPDNVVPPPAGKPAIRCFKRTTDDWYPSYRLSPSRDDRPPERLVKVSTMRLADGQWRVCVWGGDDAGMERDYPADQEKEAGAVYWRIISQEDVTRAFLESCGFRNA
jgi:hypothetical protein